MNTVDFPICAPPIRGLNPISGRVFLAMKNPQFGGSTVFEILVESLVAVSDHKTN